MEIQLIVQYNIDNQFVGPMPTAPIHLLCHARLLFDITGYTQGVIERSEMKAENAINKVMYVEQCFIELEKYTVTTRIKSMLRGARKVTISVYYMSLYYDYELLLL